MLIMPGAPAHSDFRLDKLRRELARRAPVAALQEMQAGRPFYPDANATLRLSYGRVADYYPQDGLTYRHFTTVDGILEKYKTGMAGKALHAGWSPLRELPGFQPYGERQFR